MYVGREGGRKREGWREGGRKGWREQGREGGRKKRRERQKEKGARDGGRKGGSECKTDILTHALGVGCRIPGHPGCVITDAENAERLSDDSDPGDSNARHLSERRPARARAGPALRVARAQALRHHRAAARARASCFERVERRKRALACCGGRRAWT